MDAANSIRINWCGAPPLVCVQSSSDLPFPSPPTTRGAFFHDTIYLVADNIADDADLQFVIGHEALGHAGLRAVLDAESLVGEMNRLRRINPYLERVAREKVAMYGYALELATEEALCDLAGRGLRIHGLQSLMLMIQRGLRRAGLDKLADWFESKTQSETLDLLRRAKVAVTEHGRDIPPPSAPTSAVFAHQEHDDNQVAEGSAPSDSSAHTPTKRGAPLGEHAGAVIDGRRRRASAQPDPFGLRAFGLTSLNQVKPAYRDTNNWRAVPAVMSLPNAVAEIRAHLASIEDTRGGMFSLDANGNIVIIRWNRGADLHSTMTSITALADRHGLGVLAKKSAFVLSAENNKTLHTHDFTIVAGGVTRAATGRDGPPNNVTFTRKPTGAPLFSHISRDAQLNNPTTSSHAEINVMARTTTTARNLHPAPTADIARGRSQRRARAAQRH